MQFLTMFFAPFACSRTKVAGGLKDLPAVGPSAHGCFAVKSRLEPKPTSVKRYKISSDKRSSKRPENRFCCAAGLDAATAVESRARQAISRALNA